MPLAIVADDLTGACDTGSLFARQTPVPVQVWPDKHAGAPVQVIDTESRSLGARGAAARVRAAVSGLAATRYLKKIDSTMRGAVGAEIDAMMDVTGTTTALVCPAFPAQRRLVVDRTLWVDGTPVAETPIALDPDFPGSPGSSSSVSDLLRPQCSRPVGWIPLAHVRGGRREVAARIARLTGLVIVGDAETDADLDALVGGALDTRGMPLLAGSAGLARALACQLGLLVERVPLPARRWLIVVGSLHPASRQQAEIARAAGLPVLVSPTRGDRAAGAEDRTAVAERLAAEARRVIDDGAVDAIAVTGGETALALLRALAADRIELLGPVAPGLALVQVAMPHRTHLLVVTKAGAFGDPDILVSLAKGQL
jgi:uncharacterized protein YgbK (DUF1537 family)